MCVYKAMSYQTDKDVWLSCTFCRCSHLQALFLSSACPRFVRFVVIAMSLYCPDCVLGLSSSQTISLVLFLLWTFSHGRLAFSRTFKGVQTGYISSSSSPFIMSWGGAELQSLPLVLHKTKLSNTEGSEMTLCLPYYVLHFSLHRAKCNADIQNVGGRVVIVSCIHT